MNQGHLQKLTCLGYVKMHGSHDNPKRIRGWGYAIKITHISAVAYSRLLNLASNESLGILFIFLYHMQIIY